VLAAFFGALPKLLFSEWLRFGFQPGAPQDRYRAIYEETGLNEILFQYPDVTKCSYDLDTQLAIAALPGVHYTKNGVRNMRRWDTEIPALRAFVELYLAVPYGYQLPDPGCDMKASREALSAWFTHPNTAARFHAALEQALLAGREDPSETLLWEQCYDWLDKKR